MSKNWYVVHAYSGFEKNVARALQRARESLCTQGFFWRNIVPTEEVVEMRGGQNVVVSANSFLATFWWKWN